MNNQRLRAAPAPRDEIHCSFCGKSRHDVFHIIAGPWPSFICDECIDLCAKIVAAARADRDKAQPSPTPEPGADHEAI